MQKYIVGNNRKIMKNLSSCGIKELREILVDNEMRREYYRSYGDKISHQIKLFDKKRQKECFRGVLLQISFGDNPSILEMKHPIYYQAHKTLFDYIRNSLP